MMLPSSPDAIRERLSHRLTHAPDCIRATGSTGMGWVGWMTLFSSTIPLGDSQRVNTHVR